MSTHEPSYPPADLSALKTDSLCHRRHLVSVEQFGRAADVNGKVAAFLDSLPKILAAQWLRELAAHIAKAHRDGKLVVIALGAHVVKCGLAPILIDLMERGVLKALAMNGATAIHDFEIAVAGHTSEDVAEELKGGAFGAARETAEAIAAGAERSVREGIGFGRALGLNILNSSAPHKHLSILAAAAKWNVPATVHVAFGTDTVHMHPTIRPDILGLATHMDFRILCSVVAALEGGVWLNVGSAVIMPEVFLKALTVARNLGHGVQNFVTANLDMIQHYRPRMNVLTRPTRKSYAITGHHEIMLPLLRMAILAAMEES